MDTRDNRYEKQKYNMQNAEKKKVWKNKQRHTQQPKVIQRNTRCQVPDCN